MSTEVRGNSRQLPNDDYPREMLARSRAAMDTELDQIEADIPRMPDGDKPYISDLLKMARKLQGNTQS